MSAFSGDRWTDVVFHLYRVFAWIPVADAMVLMDAPGSRMAVRSKDSVWENVLYCRMGFTSMEKVVAEEGDSGL